MAEELKKKLEMLKKEKQALQTKLGEITSRKKVLEEEVEKVRSRSDEQRFKVKELQEALQNSMKGIEQMKVAQCKAEEKAKNDAQIRDTIQVYLLQLNKLEGAGETEMDLTKAKDMLEKIKKMM